MSRINSVVGTMNHAHAVALVFKVGTAVDGCRELLPPRVATLEVKKKIRGQTEKERIALA